MFIDERRLISIEVVAYKPEAHYKEIFYSGHHRNLLTSGDFLEESNHNEANRNYLNQPECLVPKKHEDYLVKNSVIDPSKEVFYRFLDTERKEAKIELFICLWKID